MLRKQENKNKQEQSQHEENNVYDISDKIGSEASEGQQEEMKYQLSEINQKQVQKQQLQPEQEQDENQLQEQTLNQKQEPENKQKKSRNSEYDNDVLKEHENDINELIDEEIQGDQQNHSYLSKQEVEGMLSDHLEKVNAIINNPKQQQDNDCLREALKQSSYNFKSAISNKIANKTQATKDSIKSVKNNAKIKIKNGLQKINQSIKNFSERVDEKLNIDQTQTNNESNPEKENVSDNTEQAKEQSAPENAEQAKEQMINSKFAVEMESKLRNNKSLFKSAMVIYNLKETEKYINKTQDNLNQLDAIEPQNDIEQKQMDNFRNNLKQEFNKANDKYNALRENINSDENIKTLAKEIRQESEKDQQEE